MLKQRVLRNLWWHVDLARRAVFVLNGARHRGLLAVLSNVPLLTAVVAHIGLLAVLGHVVAAALEAAFLLVAILTGLRAVGL